MRRNKGGFTLPSLIITLSIIIGVSAISFASYLVFFKKEKSSEIVSDISQLESSVKSYYLVNNLYPAKYAINIGDPLSGADYNRVFTTIKSTVSLSDTEINERFKPVDMDLLNNGNYLNKLTSNEEFLVDISDGSVYYLKQFDNIGKPEFVEAKLKIEKTSGLNIKLAPSGNVALTADGREMTKVNSSLSIGNKVLLGGDGSMFLSLVQSDYINGAYQSVVKDISDKITGTNISIGDLKYVGENKVLVHYSDNGSLAYSTITIDQ